MKHYQDADPLHGHGKAIPKPQRPTGEYYKPRVEANTEEPRRPHRRVGSMATVAMMAALGWGGGYRR